MNTLFDLGEFPVKSPDAPTPKPGARYYLVRAFDGRSVGEYTLHKLHLDGTVWMPLSELARKTPHLYKTLAGAKRAAAEHGAEVRVWEGKRR